MCCFSLSFMVVNEEFGTKGAIKDVTLGLWENVMRVI